jgi:hypothetical protein
MKYSETSHYCYMHYTLPLHNTCLNRTGTPQPRTPNTAEPNHDSRQTDSFSLDITGMDSVLKCGRLQWSGPALLFRTMKKKNKDRIIMGSLIVNTHLKDSNEDCWLKEPAQNRVQLHAVFRLCCCYAVGYAIVYSYMRKLCLKPWNGKHMCMHVNTSFKAM